MRFLHKLKNNRQSARTSKQGNLSTMKILILDDEPAQLTVLGKTLQRGGFKKIKTLDDAKRINHLMQKYKPDILITDWNLGNTNGSTVIAGIRKLLAPDRYFPILVITAESRPEIKHNVLTSGADDIIGKPFAATEVILRTKNLLRIRQLDSARLSQTKELEALVKERTRQLDQAYQEVIVRLGRAAEYRDDVTGQHVWHVASLTQKLALELGLSEKQAELMMRAARLHDVGKLAVPDGILNKPGALTDAEYEIVKTHTTVGAELLSGGKSDLIRLAESIALTHHERWDGKGYPQRLAAKNIPLEGRIVALADAFDSLTRERAFKRACTLDEAICEIKQQRGKQFDPEVVDAFLHLFDKGDVSTSSAVRATLLDKKVLVT